MPEDLNAELAETLVATEGGRTTKTRWEETVEIIEAILLAVVAVATAWSGYQAARWDGRQAELYARASTTRNQADQALTLGGQQRLLDVTTFNTWIEAQKRGTRRPRGALRAPVQSGVQDRLRCLDRARSALEPRRATRSELHARVREPPPRARR